MNVLLSTEIVSESEASKGQAPGLERTVAKSKGHAFASCLHQLAVGYAESPGGKQIKAIMKEAGAVQAPPKKSPAKKATPKKAAAKKATGKSETKSAKPAVKTAKTAAPKKTAAKKASPKKVVKKEPAKATKKSTKRKPR